MNEKPYHSIVTEKVRQFQKLRRHYNAFKREGKPMEPDLYTQMLTLDEWLANNVFSWHQNFSDEDKEDHGTKM